MGLLPRTLGGDAVGLERFGARLEMKPQLGVQIRVKPVGSPKKPAPAKQRLHDRARSTRRIASKYCRNPASSSPN